MVAATSGARGRLKGVRTALRYLVAALFAWAGTTAILYAPVAPLLPPLVERPVPVLTITLGAAHLIVAIGLIRRWMVTRPLGLALVLVDTASHAILLAAAAVSTGAGGLYLVAIAAAELVIDGALLVALAIGLKPTPVPISSASH